MHFVSSVDEHLGCFHFLVIMSNAAMNIHICFCVNIHFQFSWVRMELLSHMVTLYLGNVRLFSKEAVPFYSPINI